MSTEFILLEYYSVFHVYLGLDCYFLQHFWNYKSNILHSKFSFGAWTKRWKTLWTFTQVTSEMEWWNSCGHPSKRLSDITNSSFSHIYDAQIWNVWKVVLSSCLDSWNQFRITGNTRGKCVNLSRVHFYSQVLCEVLRKILGPKREQVMRASRKEQNSPLNITIKSKVMGWTWYTTCMKNNNTLFGVVIGNFEMNTGRCY